MLLLLSFILSQMNSVMSHSTRFSSNLVPIKIFQCTIPCLESLESLIDTTPNELLKIFRSKCLPNIPKSFQIREILETDSREHQDIKLTFWEFYINICLPYSEAPIRVEKAKGSIVPGNFKYVSDNIFGSGINIPLAPPPIGCNCSLLFQNTNCPISCLKSFRCCPHLSGVAHAYNSQGTLRYSSRKPIFECNSACSCKSNCLNRVVQHYRNIPLCLFFTTNGKGWGVKTDSSIENGMFVMEYMGEVITSKEAEKRGKHYDAEGATYLFDLDFNDSNNIYTIDAKHYGNLSHFVNHSCDPNLEVFPVWINNLDINLPHIALFAKKFIEAGSELTFDYRMYKRSISKDRFKGVLCLCESSKCRKYLC